MQYPDYLVRMMDMFKHLPGVGKRSAERFAFDVLGWPEGELREFSLVIDQFISQRKSCEQCGCLIDQKGCRYCHSPSRQGQTLCVVATTKEVFALENTHEFLGLYHVLGGLLSPLEGIGPDSLNITMLQQRLTDPNINEVIIALDSTVEGDATALYLREALSSYSVNISRLAFGMPMGSSIDYVDQGTLGQAILARQDF